MRGFLAKKKESFFSCPVFVLHKIWGLAALKETKPKPNQEGSAQAAERQLVGSDAHACKSAAAARVGPQQGLPATKSQQPQKAWTDTKIRMNKLEKEDFQESGGPTSERGRGFVGTIADPTWVIMSQEEECNTASVQDAWFKSATNHVTCPLAKGIMATRPLSPIQVAKRHLLIS